MMMAAVFIIRLDLIVNTAFMIIQPWKTCSVCARHISQFQSPTKTPSSLRPVTASGLLQPNWTATTAAVNEHCLLLLPYSPFIITIRPPFTTLRRPCLKRYDFPPWMLTISNSTTRSVNYKSGGGSVSEIEAVCTMCPRALVLCAYSRHWAPWIAFFLSPMRRTKLRGVDG